MEVLLVLFVVGLVLLVPVLALVALVRGEQLQKRVKELQGAVVALEARVEGLRKRMAAGPAPSPGPTQAPVVAPEGMATAPPPPRVEAEAAAPPAPAPPRAAPAPLVRPPAPQRPLPAAAPAARPPDFATSLGPKILVATGALAFVVFLALFVKYAWENNWVGPTGRVLCGAAFGLGLVVAGVRLLGREYRPLGQGLAGAGVAGLYVSAFGAHGFYSLISREWAGILMAAITVNAVLLAARLNTRLLAALAWVGGYLTPILLSTGEDRALALYLYLTLLNLGALALDHRKPWPETAPLAVLGTLVLYAGWYARFFRPERFGVAAFGIVLFTALFAFGMARKERGPALAAVLLLGGIGLSVLAAGADRPEWLLLLSLALAGAALRFAATLGAGLAVVAAAALGLPFVAWSLAHFRPDALGLAAAWVLGGVLLFVLSKGEEAVPEALRGAVLVAAGLASVAMASAADRPVALMLFLLAQAGVAILARRAWAWAEVVGSASAFASAVAWFDAFFRPGRAGDAYLLALPVAGVYLLALVVRGLILGIELRKADLATHLLGATFAWTMLYRVLYTTDPRALGLASVTLAALYLAVGLVALREKPGDVLQVRTLLGLAAVFLTLAIPVQLGLHGITLAWAIEGLLLVALGLRFRSWLARAGGYGVLGLAVLRLLVRHFPLHRAAEAFTPVLNPAFGTWLFVIASLGVGVLLVRRAGASLQELDRVLVTFLSVAALLLLFSALTWETRDAFREAARLAELAGSRAAAEQARFQGGLAVSVLWTVFATGLLAAGLALRSRPVFYSAYGLFAVTSVKVVFVDLATLQALYRMLSFLALGLLLMAGAYLNIRFRERLLPREAER